MIDTQYHVYYFRGGEPKESFDTREEADEYIAKQIIPTEYYWEVGGRDDQE